MPTRARQAPVAIPDDTPPNAVAGRGVVDPIPFPTEAIDAITGITVWVIFTSGASEVSDDEQGRAARALQHHLELIGHTDGWKSIGAHEHPQLESEPDD